VYAPARVSAGELDRDVTERVGSVQLGDMFFLAELNFWYGQDKPECEVRSRAEEGREPSKESEEKVGHRSSLHD